MRLLVGICLCLVFVGCAKSGPPASPPQAALNESQVPVKDVSSGADMTKFKQEYALAKAAYAKKPSKTAKDTYVFTTVRLGLATMDSDELSPKEKYPGALRLFREALKVDPANEDAQKNKDLIESIYRQMKRPIPQ